MNQNKYFQGKLLTNTKKTFFIFSFSHFFLFSEILSFLYKVFSTFETKRKEKKGFPTLKIFFIVLLVILLLLFENSVGEALQFFFVKIKSCKRFSHLNL